MPCPYCGGHYWDYDARDGDLVELIGNYAVIRLEAYCDDCEKSFHCDVTFECDGSYKCVPMEE